MTQTYSDALVNDLMARNAAEQDSAVRTRDEQVAEYFFDNEFQFAEDMTEEAYIEQLKIAEVRGAAEQRRKDAEGQEPVGFLRENTIKELLVDDWTIVTITRKKTNENIVPIYTRPANVAALEARVKELEEALNKADEFITNGIEFGFIRMPDSDTPDTALDTPGIIRAALTREGGE